MTKASIWTPDSLSAFMDAELQAPEKDVVLAQLLTSAKDQAQWHAYHVLGDVMRSDELAGAADDWQFWTRLEARLAQEPTIPKVPSATTDTPLPWSQHTSGQSANAALFKWRAVAGAACTVLLAVLGTLVWTPVTPSASLATGPAPIQVNIQDPQLTTAVIAPDGMIRDPRLDQLLSAHQQLGGHSALQMPSGFLRNATYEGAGR
jgi:sigma-E factor negative regulatory protein RseA